MDAGEVVHEAGAVEVGVGADLEVGGGAFRFEADELVDVAFVADERAEEHFIVAAEGAAEAAAHPCFQKRGRAFMKPARGVLAGAGEEAEADGDRVVPGGDDFAMEEAAKAAFAGGGGVPDDDVAEFVAGEQRHAFGGGHGIENQAERGHADLDDVVGKGSGGAVAEILEVPDHDGDWFGGLVAEGVFVEQEGVFQGADEDGGEVFVGGAVVDDAEVAGFLEVEAQLGRERRGSGEGEEKCEEGDSAGAGHRTGEGKRKGFPSGIEVVNSGGAGLWGNRVTVCWRPPGRHGLRCRRGPFGRRGLR